MCVCVCSRVNLSITSRRGVVPPPPAAPPVLRHLQLGRSPQGRSRPGGTRRVSRLTRQRQLMSPRVRSATCGTRWWPHSLRRPRAHRSASTSSLLRSAFSASAFSALCAFLLRTPLLPDDSFSLLVRPLLLIFEENTSPSFSPSSLLTPSPSRYHADVFRQLTVLSHDILAVEGDGNCFFRAVIRYLFPAIPRELEARNTSRSKRERERERERERRREREREREREKSIIVLSYKRGSENSYVFSRPRCPRLLPDLTSLIRTCTLSCCASASTRGPSAPPPTSASPASKSTRSPVSPPPPPPLFFPSSPPPLLLSGYVSHMFLVILASDLCFCFLLGWRVNQLSPSSPDVVQTPARWRRWVCGQTTRRSSA